jgi:hypothetical protein
MWTGFIFAQNWDPWWVLAYTVMNHLVQSKAGQLLASQGLCSIEFAWHEI